jgi:hypothetical protein
MCKTEWWSDGRPHLIGWADLKFNTRPVLKRSNLGTPYLCQEPYGMPRVPDQLLNGVFYLYASAEDARSGKNFGGTGFFVFFPERDGPSEGVRGWTYAVTNWHVAVRDGFPVMRVNTRDGKTEIFDFGPEDWEFDPRFDIAIKSFSGILNREVHKFSVVPTRGFCSELMARNQNIGPGDDVFMVGRFVDHDGGQSNQPALRFGHISINPTPMRQGPNQLAEPCYCIDIHSRTGYSGSPVFVYRTVASDLLDVMTAPVGRDILVSGTRYFGLLGIHFGQFPELWELGKGLPKSDEALVAGQSAEYVKGMSGMTCVLPSWTIAEVLNMTKLKNARRGKEIKFTHAHHQNLQTDDSSSSPVEESAPVASEGNPKHREDFTALLDVAARKQKQDD